MRSVDELRELVEDALAELSPAGPAGLDEAFRYALEGGGKRIRPVLCLAVGEAVGAEPEDVLPAACALELVHSFSLVHDDLPALDDDDTRRGRPSTWAQFGESVAVLAGDALLVEAFRLALTYDTPAVARELAAATLGMIGGQYLDVTGSADDLAALNRLKTGRLFEASVALAARSSWLRAANVADVRAARSARCSSSSTTSSTATVTCSPTARRRRAGEPTRPPSGRSRPWRSSTPTRASCGASSRAWPRARPDPSGPPLTLGLWRSTRHFSSSSTRTRRRRPRSSSTRSWAPRRWRPSHAGSARTRAGSSCARPPAGGSRRRARVSSTALD